MGTGFSKKKKQAKMMQEKLAQMQEHMQKMEVSGTAGGSLVQVTINGEHELKSIKIKPECVDPDDIEGLEDLIKAAFNDAEKKLQAESGNMMPGGGFSGGMAGLGGGIPGLDSLSFSPF